VGFTDHVWRSRSDVIRRILSPLSSEDQGAVGSAFVLFADAAGEPPRSDLLRRGL
jgi:hypothetical protein